jgi:hypothetical protein
MSGDQPLIEPAVAAPAVARSAPLGPSTGLAALPARVLALQAAAGNRAVAGLIRPLAREATKVTQAVREETTGADNVNWNAVFEVDFDDDTKTCRLTIKVKLSPDGGVSKDDVSQVKVGVLSKFSLLWDSKFTLHEHNRVFADVDWLLRPQIKFVDSGQHLTIALHPGKGADNRQNWYVGSPEVTHAHEISHQMGLLDEYEDITVKNRKAYTDHSIMGDYYNEGQAEAEAKLRHGERLAKIIGAATDKNLTARKT